MRFAYIDSQGKEVGIPSVEALGLRIELGAITPSTELYDAAADRWAPASEHEVFRTLSREIQEKGEGFVAPPPPAASSDAPESPPAEPPPSEPSPADADEPGAASPAPTAEAPPARRAPNPFEMIEGPPGEAAVGDDAPAAPARPPADGGLDIGMDFTLAELEEDEAGEDDRPEAPPPGSAAGGEGGADELGGMERLEVQGSSLADDQGDAVFSGDSIELEDMLSTSYGDEPPARPAAGGAASLWGDDVEGDGDEDDDEVPAQARDDAPSGPAAPAYPPTREELEAEEARLREEAEERRAAARARFDDGGASGDDGGEGRRRERPRAASAPPPPPARSGIPGALVGVVLLVVVGGAGWLGWSALRGGADGPTGEAEPEVAIPPISTELEPRFREAADTALAATLAGMRALLEERELPAEPPDRWLSGAYMANAGDFPGVATYFEALRQWLDEVRASDSTAFNAAFAAALDSTEADTPQGELMRRRAAAGFAASGRDRRRAYADFEAVLDATTSLHAFLLENQDQIDYEPAASGVSRDPVLEAVPTTPAIGDEMWDRVDGITEALDTLGALDQVTTERLVEVLLSRLERAGVR